ncbi:MAG: (d)CMP kinase [Chloroflexota bacterium]
MKNIIAIDGPAASGKTTLGKLLAAKFEYLFFDTGVMYRAVTLAVVNAGISIEDKLACSKLAEDIQIDVLQPSEEDGRSNDVLIDGVDSTWDIVKPEVVACVSEISAIPGVRKALTAKQREIGLRGNVVMVGRDIGTVVLPEAGVKIYLNASPEERAKRRYDERIARGEPVDYDTLLAVIKKRDKIDSNREVAPLAAAEDAYILESDGKDAGAVFQEALGVFNERTAE